MYEKICNFVFNIDYSMKQAFELIS